MLRSRIVPCLLLSKKGLVKTRQFGERKYVGDPVNAVKIFNEKLVDELTIFDIDATVEGRGPDIEFLKMISLECRMPLCYGGGVQNSAQAIELIKAGFEKVSISAAALARPAIIREISDAIGTQSVVVTLDVRRAGPLRRHRIFTRNGKAAERIDLVSFLEEAETLGAGEIVINSIERDGMMNGYDLDLARLVRKHVSLPMTMVGGAGEPDHMKQLIDAVGTVGAGAGSMFVFHGIFRAVLISYDRPELLARG